MTVQAYSPLRLFTPQEVAAYLGIRVASLRQLDLAPIRIRRRNYYRVRDVAAFIERHLSL